MTSASIKMYNTEIGVVSWDEPRSVGVFEYTERFLDSGIEVSPISMPLRSGTFRFEGLSRDTFKGLPGLLADSLPDKFGNLLIDQWLARQGRSAQSFNPVERLCYLGTRAMGALEFSPALSEDLPGRVVDLKDLVRLANDALAARHDFRTQLVSKKDEEALSDILRVGTSAGGARAKAVIAWNPETQAIRSGQVVQGEGFEHWLLKFDGVSGNADKEMADPQGYGRVEYAYHLMARAAGITMSDCFLLEENGRAHFMTRRFDRTATGQKVHMQSLCALAHFDFNIAGGTSYEQAFGVARRLGLGQDQLSELYRRAVFNIIARNQDDHTKNISFQMDRRGGWSLAPAYDLMYAYNPSGAWASQHQMTFSGKRDDFTRQDMLDAARNADVKPRHAIQIVDEVVDAVRDWPDFAEAAGVDEAWRKQIAQHHRLLNES